MKKNLLYFFMLITTLNLFSSCDKDDVNDKIELIGEELNGVYKGELDIELDGTPIGNDIPQKVYITKTGENMLKMELKNFSFTGINLGDIVVEEIIVLKNGAENSLAGTQKLTLLGVGACDVTVIGDIKADILDMDITVKAGPLNVVVDFEGTKMDADQSSEALITAFTFDNPLVIQQPVIAGNKITFLLDTEVTADEIKALIPTITISENATISPATGVATDFTNPVKYVVTSEDGIYTKEYTVSILGKASIYSFEEWEDIHDATTSKDFKKPLDGWDTSNAGVAMIMAFDGLYTGEFPNKPTEDSKEGKFAAHLETINSTGQKSLFPGVFPAIPNITASSLFLGEFKINALNTLKSTRFGIPCNEKPLNITGFYKYIAGAEYFHCANPEKQSNIATLDITKEDEFAISAVLYTSSEEGLLSTDDCLTGVNLFTSDRIIAQAQLIGGNQADFKEFNLELEYTKEYDPKLKYKLAIVFSSSKNGDKFSGAPGSTLIVDEVSVMY